MRIFVLMASLVLVIIAQAQTTTGNTTVQGQVFDPAGNPVAGAVVVASMTALSGIVDRPDSAGGLSDRDGRFSIKGLRGGLYQICVSVPRSGLLNPCDWSESPKVQVAPGATSELVSIRLEQGVHLRLRLDDPKRAIQPFKPDPKRYVQPALRIASGRQLPFRLVSSDIDAHDYDIAVPADLEFEVAFEGVGVQVADERGAAINRNNRTRLKIARSVSNHQLRFRLGATTAVQ